MVYPNINAYTWSRYSFKWGYVMKSDLENWVKYIGSQTLPVFNSTIQRVIKLTTEETSTSKELADMIMQDASLTSRVIQVANSPFYNRSNIKSDSVRRMVLLIGFKRIAEICFTLSILDSVAEKNAQKIIFKIISQSFHAATHAHALAKLCHINDSDKIYIAALLKHIGEIAFWSLTGKSGNLISDLINCQSNEPEKVQEQILGTTFKKLSLGLAEQWNLSQLLKESLSVNFEHTLDLKCIKFGHEITEIKSNDYAKLEPIATFISSETKVSFKEVMNTIQANIIAQNNAYDSFLK